MTKAKWLAAAALVTATIATPALAQDRMTRDQAKEQARMRTTTQDVYVRDVSDSRGYWRTTSNDDWNRDNWNRSSTGFWPGDVAANVVSGAVTTAGEIATAPFRGDSYAYYGDDWNNRYRNSYEGRVVTSYRGATPPNNGSWASNSLSASYAERNGFVCQPGTLFTGQDGREHLCQ